MVIFQESASEQYAQNENPNQMDLGDIGISPDMILSIWQTTSVKSVYWYGG